MHIKQDTGELLAAEMSKLDSEDVGKTWATGINSFRWRHVINVIVSRATELCITSVWRSAS